MTQNKYKRILVTAALPYANGPIHLGHLAGAYLPADVYVRYQRLKKRDVVFICGTDEHGVPITIAAEKQGITPQQLVDRYWADHYDSFTRFGISFDNFSRTSLPIHHRSAKDFFKVIHAKNYLIRRTTQQFYCENCSRFLPDRFVEGKCPKCGVEGARGDQCEKCGSSLEQTELIEPYCKICSQAPVLRETSHLFLKLNEFQKKLQDWLATKTDWKENVLNYCRGWFADGLGERAVTRDLNWGIQVPIEGYEDKVIYVWFEAPIGYISSTMEWAEKQGRPDLWKKYWQDPETKLVHFIGKDNIVFHAIIWPAMLLGHGDYILPSEIPANEFLNLEGNKLSTSRNYAVWLGDYLQKFPPDPLRYYLAINAPETKDADFTWQEFQSRNNGELADILGNFINRTLTFTAKNFANKITPRTELDDLDRKMLQVLAKAPALIGELLEKFELRKAANALVDVGRAANKYFNDQEPWRAIRDDRSKCATTLNICIHAVQSLAVLMAPIMPFAAQAVWQMVGNAGDVNAAQWDDCGTTQPISGQTLGKLEILFRKFEEAEIQPEMARLENIRLGVEPQKESEKMPEATRVSYQDFSKLELRIARIVHAEKIEKAEKLLKLQIEIGPEKRQIVAGIAKHYTPEELVGKKIVVVTNLEPAVIRGIESNGMLLAAEDESGILSVITLDRDVAMGAKVK